MSFIRPGKDAATVPLPYVSSFPATENPLSEAGKWRNGLLHGLDWHDMQTGSGNAYGTASSPTEDDDNIACLSPAFFSFGDDQYIEAVLHLAAGYSPVTNHEIELHIGCTINGHSITTMEFLLNTGGGSGINRWDGVLNNVVILSPAGTGPTGPVDLDTFRFSRVGNVYTVKQNGVTVYTLTDATRVGGTPGIATFSRSGGDIVQSSYGWGSITTGNGA